MGPTRRSRSPIQSRACLNCQKRKSRCLLSADAAAAGGPCSYCARTGKTCSFIRPPDRTPLTRKNLDAAESRCARLQALLRQLHPELDVEEALAGVDAGDGAVGAVIGQGSAPGAPFEHIGSAAAAAAGDAPDPADREQPAHEFEWHEASPQDLESPATDARLQDGMATLSTLDSGYLGSSSGSNLLQEIANLLPDLAASTVQDDTDKTSPSSRWQSRPRTASEVFLDPPELANPVITGHLIDAYFLFYNISYPILHEKTFRKKLASRPRRQNKSTWNVIYFMVLAFGHWISTTDAHHAQSRHYLAARSFLSIQMLESGTLETVQAFLLMGNYLQKVDRPNTGYNFIGIAYKMALGLGLHRETPRIDDTVGNERKRQLFWTVYCVDSGFNITTGRPPNVSEGVIDTHMPRNIIDEATDIRAPVPAEVQGPTPISAIRAQAELARLANGLYHEFLLAKTANTKLEYQVAEAIDRGLASWRQSLPAYFSSADVPTWFLGPRAVVLWKELNLRIILWRGSRRHHAFLSSKMDAETRCLDAAMQSIHDIAAFCGAYEGILHLGIAWYATYFLFQAALVLEASCLDRENQKRRPDETALWQAVAAKARDCLVILARKSKSASRCLEVLDPIHRRTEAVDRVAPPPPAPQTGETEMVNGGTFAEPVPTTSGGPHGTTMSAPMGHEYTGLAVNEFGLYEDTSDPTLRMIMDQTPWGYLDSTPVDALFNDWIYPQFEVQNNN